MSLGTKGGPPHPQKLQDSAHAAAAAVALDHDPLVSALGVEPVPGQLSAAHPGGVAIGVLPGGATPAAGVPTLPVTEPQMVGSYLGAPDLVVPYWRADWPHP